MSKADNLIVVAYPIAIIQEHENGEQVSKHKKKRINKKWLKRYGTYCEMLDPGEVVLVGGQLLMSRRTYNNLKQMERKENG